MSAPSTAHAPAPRPQDPRLTAEVTTWVAEGLITDEQGARLLARGPVAAPPAHRPAPTSVVAEALGYLGGVVVLVGAILIGARVWHQIDTPGRLAVLGLAAARRAVDRLAGRDRRDRRRVRLRGPRPARPAGRPRRQRRRRGARRCAVP